MEINKQQLKDLVIDTLNKVEKKALTMIEDKGDEVIEIASAVRILTNLKYKEEDASKEQIKKDQQEVFENETNEMSAEVISLALIGVEYED